MKLRQYQREDLVKCQMDIMAGRNRNLIVWATGLGKTVLMAHIVGRLRKKRALIIVNREELVWQTVDKVRASYPELTVSVEKAEHRSTPDSEVVVASIQTIGSTREEEDGTPIFSERLKSIDPDTFDIVIVDECFVAGTLIDGRPIELIRPGDLVSSFNHEAKTEELRPVVRLFKSKPSSLMTISLSNGQKITCTEEHPFFVNGEYVPANRIAYNDILTLCDSKEEENREAKELLSLREDVHAKIMEQKYGSILRRGLQEGSEGGPKEKSLHELPTLQQRSGVVREGSVEAKKRGIHLFERVRQGGSLSSPQERRGIPSGIQPEVCFRENEETEPHAQKRNQGSRLKEAYRNGAQAENPRRERSRVNSSRREDPSRIGHMYDTKTIASVSIQNNDRTFKWIPDPLQDRRGYSRTNDSNRSGREFSLCDIKANSRQKETGFPRTARVVGIEIHEQTSDGTFGGMCPGGFVYNFEVEGNNNYYANGVLVHNCHRASSDTFRNALKYFKVYLSDERYNDESKILFGLTATPNRSDNKGLNEFFNRITASRDIRWGIQNKYLTDIEAYRVETRVDISDVKITAGDFNHRQLEKKINTPARNELVISKYKEIAEGKKALFFTLDIQHAEDLAAEANKQGVKAMAVSSRTPAQTRKEIIDMHKRGELTALMSALLFCEGYDDPTVEVGCMVRPFRSGLIYRQAVGRVLRPCPAPETLNAMREAGKEPDWIKDTAIIIDFVDVSSRHNLISVPTLFGLNPKIDTKGKRLEEFTKDLENLVDKLPDKIKKKTNLEEIEDPTTLTGIIEKVDLVSIPETPQEVGKCSDMSWIKKDDTYILNMPTRTMTVRPNSMGMYDVKINTNGVSSFAGVGSTLEEAIGKAEKRLTSEEKKAGSSSAAWRGNPISDKQIALLAKIDRSGVAKMNGDINKYKAVLRHSMNAGQAQALISSLLAKKRI